MIHGALRQQEMELDFNADNPSDYVPLRVFVADSSFLLKFFEKNCNDMQSSWYIY